MLGDVVLRQSFPSLHSASSVASVGNLLRLPTSFEPMDSTSLNYLLTPRFSELEAIISGNFTIFLSTAKCVGMKFINSLQTKGTLYQRHLGQSKLSIKASNTQSLASPHPNPNVATFTPDSAVVWDIDSEDAKEGTIANLKAAGKIVICYFSAGTVEDWRPDAGQFQSADKGKILPDWPHEKWLNLKSTNVRNIMKARIQNAYSKGCDAIDPDNTDAYQNDNGLNLQRQDSIDYIKFLASTAAALGMKVGLKNSLAILSDVSSVISFAVNEQCQQFSECSTYHNFILSGKPVFHIEYPTKTSSGNPSFSNSELTAACKNIDGFSTVLKGLVLDGWVEYCDGSIFITNCTPPTGPITTRRSPTRTYATSTTSVASPTTPTTIITTTSPPDNTPTETPTTSTDMPSTTTTARPSKTSSSPSKPTTTTSNGGGNGGCTSKHWDQCGGKDWKGCTVCAAGLQCKGVSPPYYYQCL
ncbi:hypothetical protein G7Y89_g1363 [Cudoniella acicularis]|uniref:alpha-galactosidase n=1 Tax=Cudoniella acicularis TaxID=354080 RepID=A0A8H4RWI8_9HELO|nr:hypothetical protein G7Y89_g1363 [Cudoniella acicularis]